MAKRLEQWHGYNEEQLKKMDLKEFAKYVKARPRRTLLRMTDGSSEPVKKLIDKIRKLKSKGKVTKHIKTYVRDAIIIPEWIGLVFKVHNGKENKIVEITLEKLGHRLGDFSHTTKMVKHSGAGVGATRGSKFVPLK